MIGMDQLLEVIALDPADAVAAVRGGADRLEIVADMATEGLTADRRTICEIRDAVDVPLRVMVRNNSGFEVTPKELAELCTAGEQLAGVGVDEIVMGFLTDDAEPDVQAIGAVLEAARPKWWTFHRAFDHAVDPEQTWKVLESFDGIDTVMSAGSATGIDIDAYRVRVTWQGNGTRWMVGGGLREEHVPELKALGLRRFHVGRGVRVDRSWDRPVDSAAVERWRTLIDA